MPGYGPIWPDAIKWP